MRRRTLTPLATASFIALTLSGCFGTGPSKYDYYEPEIDSPVESYDGQEPDYEPDPSDFIPPPPEPTGWTCSYDETLNNDWHDDVICRNGYESHRPYLLEWSDFVTYDDIMNEAANYEAYLNSQ